MLFGAQLRWLGGWLLLRLGLGPARLWLSPFAFWPVGVLSPCRESFPHLCRRAARMQPDLAPLFQAMADQQQLLAHAPLTASQRRHHSRQWRQLRSRLGRIR